MKSIPNEVRHDPENKTTIITVERRNGKTYDVLVDEWIYPLIKDLHLHVKPSRAGRQEFYPATYVGGKLWYLHRLIMGVFLDKDHPEVDHIDSTATLDNRRRNLRPANRIMQMRNTSRYRSQQ